MKRNYPVVIVTGLMLFLADCGAAALLLATFHCAFDIIFSWQSILVFGLVFLAIEIISFLLLIEMTIRTK